MQQKEFTLNKRRTGQFGILGFFFFAPMLHMNYTKILPTIAPDGVKYQVLKKLIFDQTIFASTMMGGFYVLNNLLEGHTIQKGLSDLREKYWTTLLVNW